jgi:hypothetical protein
MRRCAPAADTHPMKRIKGFVVGFLAATAVASGAPAMVHLVSARPAAPVVADEETPSPDPTESPTTDPTESPDPDGTGSGEEGELTEELSDLHGLDNAMSRVSQNLADHPNHGLENALSHLQANDAKHEAHEAEKEAKHEEKAGSKRR